jgi:hypothetical protein
VDEVRDHHMGVKVGVAFSGGAMTERRGYEAVAVDLGQPALPSPSLRPHRFEELETAGDCRVVGVADLVGHLREPESEEQRHRFRGVEGGVEPWDLRRPLRAGQPLPRRRVQRGEHSSEVGAVDLTLQAEQSGGAAGPLAGGLACACVVVLQSGGDR